MAIKKGIDYFSMNTTFDTSVRLLLARFKNSGLGIWMRILQALYREEGYFMAWDEESALLLAEELSEDVKTLNQLVTFCVDKEIFDNNLYEKYKILTSRRIQENFYKAAYRRKDIDVRADFVIYEPMRALCKHDVSRNTKNVSTMSAKTPKMLAESDKLNKTKLNNNNTMHAVHADKDTASKDAYPDKFESFYNLYPNAKEKQRTFKNWKKIVKEYSETDILNAAVNYKKEMLILKRDKQYMKTSANFLGKDNIFVDFLDANYKQSNPTSASGSQKTYSNFHNFEQQYCKMSAEKLEEMARKN